MSNFLDTKHKRKSAAITSVIMSLLVVAIFFVGMTYLDPPEEYGIAVNFGTSNVGSGNIQPKEPIKSASEEKVVEETQEEIEEVSKPDEVKEVTDVSEEVATQETEESIAIKKAEERKKKILEAERKKQLEKDRIERAKQEAIAKQKAEEAAKRKKLDAMMGGINNSTGTENGGEGNDNQAGDKGKITGDPNASGYYGNGGTGSDGDFQLGNRNAISKPKPNYFCDEEGVVVVKIEVDKNGKVIKATPGVQGTTAITACTLEEAKKAALKTTWQPDSKAPSKQVGTIKYTFSLSQ